MGQIAQIYVRWQRKNKPNGLIASYFHWCYGERLVSRARHTIEWLEGYSEFATNEKHYEFILNNHAEQLRRILEVNFDYKDIVLSDDILKDYEEDRINGRDCNDFVGYVFTEVANNDGKLFIDIKPDGKIKYCFTDQSAGLDSIMDAEQYMNFETKGCTYDDWRNTEYVDAKVCMENIKFLNEHAELMTAQELDDFIHDNYID